MRHFLRLNFALSCILYFVYGAALGKTSSKLDLLQMSGGLLGALFVFTSLLGLNRSFAYEKEQGALEGILLVPMDRGVIFLSKALSNFLFMLVVELISVPRFYFFFMGNYGFPASFVLVIVAILVGTIGMSAVGTLLSTITAATRGKDVLLAVLFIPLIFPLLYVCVTATTAALVGANGFMDSFTVSLAIAAAYDVIMGLASWVLYDFVISA